MSSRLARKMVVALLLLAVLPFAAAAYLLDQVMDASERIAAGEAELRRQAFEHARSAYTELLSTRKAQFRAAAERLVTTVNETPLPLRAPLVVRELEHDGALKAVRLLDGAGDALAEWQSEKNLSQADFRELLLDQPLPPIAAGEARWRRARRIQLVYVTPRAPFVALDALSELQSNDLGLRLLGGKIGTLFRRVFLGAFLLVVTIAGTLGLWLAQRFSRRVTALAVATRNVASGDLSTRVGVEGNDELSDLAFAFNQMVKQLTESRERIRYLEKIGAWQEVARRLAHEIKNPLTPIQLAVQQLQESYPGSDSQYARTLAASNEIVVEEIAGLRRLVEEFSAFAKLPRVEAAPLDANALLKEFLRSYSGFDGKARFTPPTGEYTVLGDRLLLKRALHNLVSNALEAGATQVELLLERDESEIVVAVEDNGPGLPANLELFDPYVTTKEHGTGLGLAIVKKIALEHGGSVTATNRPAGGARFTLRLRIR